MCDHVFRRPVGQDKFEEEPDVCYRVFRRPVGQDEFEEELDVCDRVFRRLVGQDEFEEELDVCDHVFRRPVGQDEFEEELDVVSVIPTVPPADWDSDTSHLYRYRVTARTGVTFLARVYRLVFCLDLSPSVATVVRLTIHPFSLEAVMIARSDQWHLHDFY